MKHEKWVQFLPENNVLCLYLKYFLFKKNESNYIASLKILKIISIYSYSVIIVSPQSFYQAQTQEPNDQQSKT